VRGAVRSSASNASARSYVPVPVRLTFCGLPPPSSLIETAAVRFPVAEGVKVTATKQLAPPATLVPQVLVWAKSLASVGNIMWAGAASLDQCLDIFRFNEASAPTRAIRW